MKSTSLVIGLMIGFIQIGYAKDQEAQKDVQKFSVLATETGFEPSHVQVQPGKDAELTFTRITDKTCATSVSIPKLKIKAKLPLNKPVVIKLPKLEKGEIKFMCGMNMMESVIEIK